MRVLRSHFVSAFHATSAMERSTQKKHLEGESLSWEVTSPRNLGSQSIFPHTSDVLQVKNVSARSREISEDVFAQLRYMQYTVVT